MTLKRSISEFRKALLIADTLRKKESDAIDRAASGVYPETLNADRRVALSFDLDADLRHMYSHADAVRRIRAVIPRIELSDLVAAFVAGLNPAQVRWRAPLQAYAACCNLPAHRADFIKDMFSPLCRICGLESRQEWRPVEQALSMAKSGLVGYGTGEIIEVFDAAVCLEWFLDVQYPQPNKEDWRRLKKLIVHNNK